MSPWLQWLMTPLSGVTDHRIDPATFWHARSMVLAWAVLLPLGALVARFYKVRPGQGWPGKLDDKWWWDRHRALQYAGCAVMLVGLWFVYDHGGRPGLLAWSHHWLGWVVVVMALAQLLSAGFRGSKGGPTDRLMRGAHYDMTRQRHAFEWFHKGVGWLSLLLSLAVFVSGLIVVDAPRWMPLVLGCWYLLLFAAFWRLQRQGRCHDTYQAIWGPDPAHPGNGPRRTGFGVRRG